MYHKRICRQSRMLSPLEDWDSLARRACDPPYHEIFIPLRTNCVFLYYILFPSLASWMKERSDYVDISVIHIFIDPWNTHVITFTRRSIPRFVPIWIALYLAHLILSQEGSPTERVIWKSLYRRITAILIDTGGSIHRGKHPLPISTPPPPSPDHL